MKKHILLLFVLAGSLWAAPPTPTRHVTDKASVLTSSQLEALDSILVNYEAKTTNQLIVYVDKKMQGADLTEWCQAWGIGQKGKDNGAALFLFVEDRKSEIKTGYGMEASLPDATCKVILDGMRTKLRAKDYAGALTDAVGKMTSAMDGTFAVTASASPPEFSLTIFICVVVGIVVLFFIIFLISEGGTGSTSSGASFRSGSSGSSSGYGGSSSKSSSGGFRSGGGGFGGGGASGGW